MNNTHTPSLEELGCFYLNQYYYQRRENVKLKLCAISNGAFFIACIITQHALYTNTNWTKNTLLDYMTGVIFMLALISVSHLFFRRRILKKLDIEHKEQKVIYLQLMQRINQENIEALKNMN